MSTTQTVSTIQINFIRNPHGDGHDDDILTISKTDSKQYTLSYKDKTAQNPVPHYVHLDRDDVFDHLETTFDMLNIDIAPYKQIQILAPTFPSILLRVDSLSSNEIRDTVFRVVDTTMDNWPAPVISAVDNLRRSARLAGRTL
jgi:hypothetical protein